MKESKNDFTKRGKFEKTKILLDFLQLIGILFLGISVWLAYKSNLDQNKWRKYEFTYELVTKFENFEDLRTKLEKFFPEMCGKFPKDYAEISPEKFLEIENTTKENRMTKLRGIDVDGYYIKCIINDAFNYLEDVAYAYTEGLADREYIDLTLKHIFLKWEKIFGNFRTAVNNKNPKKFVDHWPPITKLMEIWNK